MAAMQRWCIHIPQAEPVKQKTVVEVSQIGRRSHTSDNIIGDSETGILISVTCGAFLITNAARNVYIEKSSQAVLMELHLKSPCPE